MDGKLALYCVHYVELARHGCGMQRLGLGLVARQRIFGDASADSNPVPWRGDVIPPAAPGVTKTDN